MVNYCSFVTNVMRSQIKLNGEQVIPFVNLVNEICEIGFLPEDKYIADWLTESREFLDNKSPIELINEEKIDKLLDLIRLIEIEEADVWEPMKYIDA